MNSQEEKCINALSKLWHEIMYMGQHINIKDQFIRLKKLTPLDVGIINLVSKNPEIIFREICEQMDIPKSTLTNVIDRLENGKYLRRFISNKDRRSYGLELTEEGKLVQQEHIKFEFHICSEIIKTLEVGDERNVFLKLVNKISDSLCNNLERRDHDE